MTSDTIVVSNANGGIPPPPDTRHRAVHQIKRSSLSHNYACVESAANRQKCSVIVVVKADGYGHGAIQTALHLADSCGADAFAVATLEEAIALRKAFELPHNNNHRNGVKRNSVTNLFLAPGTAPTDPRSRSASPITNTRSMRSPHIRILVLGPPVGYPRCFDDYYYYNVEVMVCGPEVAQALMHWVANPAQRKRTLVERAAQEAKQKALSAHPSRQSMIATSICHGTTDDEENSGQDELEEQVKQPAQPHSAATLSNVSGHDLAKEVRAILISQHAAKNQADNHVNTTNGSISFIKPNNSFQPVQPPPSSPPSTPKKGEMFGGIEAAAHTSRMRHIAAAKASEVFVEDDRCETATSSVTSTVVGRAASRVKRRLRWHALVDSGMGRLGFRTEAVPRNDVSGKYDTVDIIKEMVDAEVHTDAPLEFYGMCTHMAEANESSTYTNSQIQKFKDLLNRVRRAGISIPTVSTDNSAALLTPTLTHFEPDEILSQPDAHTRGYVRCGGAIYGQRPAFKQLRAVSTLKASVRHVAVLKEGESVGYDRAYIAPRDVRIATLTIGFADGYPRELGNGVGKVSIRGAVFPVAGNVCMDMLMVDLGPAEDDGIGSQVGVGDVATLWGPETEHDDEGLVRLQDLAATLKTTQSAFTCGLNKNRVPREMI
jgi:alanine racemase